MIRLNLRESVMAVKVIASNGWTLAEAAGVSNPLVMQRPLGGSV
ncbi:hypothetical protein [Nonomuraea sp. NPDC050310]